MNKHTLKEIKEYAKTLSKTPPEGSNLKVGDVVTWVNAYGVKWTNKIIGFKYSGWYHEEYESFVHIDSDCYWCSHSHKNLKKVKS